MSRGGQARMDGVVVVCVWCWCVLISGSLRGVRPEGGGLACRAPSVAPGQPRPLSWERAAEKRISVQPGEAESLGVQRGGFKSLVAAEGGLLGVVKGVVPAQACCRHQVASGKHVPEVVGLRPVR